jgi:biopolymer transport protein ExbB
MDLINSGDFSVIRAFLNLAAFGAEWVMWLLIGLGSVLGVLVIERLRLYASTQIDISDIGLKLVHHLESGEIDKARGLVAGSQAMEKRVIADALQVWSRGYHAVEHVIQSSLERERQRFDRYLGFIGTLGSNAPFIGLFGTVVGIIISFQRLASDPKGGMAVVGPGIAEALVATAMGLLVAIPAVVAFNSFKGVVGKRIGNTELLGRIVMAQLKPEER